MRHNKLMVAKMSAAVCLAMTLVACGDSKPVASQPAAANLSGEEWTGTLKKIKDSGEVVLGHRDNSIPFSYLVSGIDPIGYSHDLQMVIVDKIKATLAMPDLKVRYALVTSQTRIPLVQNGTVDLECGSTTNNEERQKQVDFTVGIFDVATRLLVKKSSNINDFKDLAGKNVAVTAGTTSERILKMMNDAQDLKMNIISAKDHGESFLMVETGRAQAFMMDDALLYGEMAKAKNPDEWAVVGEAQSHEIYGCMLPKGDPAFKAVADQALTDFYKTAGIQETYKRWFESPIPPKNLSLNFPMSDTLKRLITAPTDQAQLPTQ